MSFLEETVEGRARIGSWALESTGRFQMVSSVKITEVCFLAIGYPFGLRLATLVVSVLIVVVAIQAAMDIGATTWAFIASRDVAPDFQLGAAVMTNHSSLH